VRLTTGGTAQTESQDKILKEQARKLGISEAGLARRALSEFLSERSPRATERPDALRALLNRTRSLSEKHRFPSGYRFDREDLYRDRVDRPSGSDR